MVVVTVGVSTSGRAAVGWALTAALSFSSLPVGVHLFAANINPFWFNTVLVTALTVVLGAGIVLSGASGATLLKQVPAAVMPLWRRGFRGRVALTVMVTGNSGLGLFVVSVHHAGAATAAVLYQLWTISAAALLAVRGGWIVRRWR